jgi:hypothetical protein
MWLALLLSGGLALGQAEEPPPEKPAAEEAQAVPPPGAPAERWPLMKHLQGTWYGSLLDDNKLRLYGWADVSYTGSTDAHNQLPMGFNYRANDFLLQQNWVRFERPTDQKATVPTFGFRWDNILPGSDYRFTIARGLFDEQLHHGGNPPTYGIDPVQFYGEAYFPQVCRGLLIRVGRFFCQYGNESIDATQNQIGSRSYAFIYDPFTHTGTMAQIQLDEAWSVQSGLETGSDIFIAPGATPTYMGSVKWAPPRGRATAFFGVILSDPRFDEAHNFNRPQIFDFIFTYKLDERMTYTFEGLYGYQVEVPNIGFANWYSTVHYLNRQLSPRTSGTLRLEFFDDIQGQRTGFPGLYTALTAGVNFKPRAEVVLRPEVRYDYNEQSRPFEGKKGVLTATMDMILRW